ncbi:MAG TPA: hypothetical protein DDW17_09150 [Deltaproteobacteria bacterium]|nr:hypothetical protein [Deltaproteobacteria bacterium]
MPSHPQIFDYIRELHFLWRPVFPYLAIQIKELYGRAHGRILEMGPFIGVSRSLFQQKVGDMFFIATFPGGIGRFLKEEIAYNSESLKYTLFETNPSLDALKENSVDLVIFRGAFFFPALFIPDIKAIHRVLRAEGVAIVGGGFGKYTPPSLIEKINERSRELNILAGKTNILPETIKTMISLKGMEDFCEVISEGGLWVIIRKVNY